ncbi:MAG: hypothetical protein WC823_05190, partial [Parcubacteria group bacterium]|jgi:Tol biopolymer transport system component
LLAAIFLLSALAMIFFPGKNESGQINNKITDDNGKKLSGEDEAFYQRLYNPPTGGNPENKGKIVFSSDRGETTGADYDLYTMNSDGSGKVRLTTVEKFISHPVWSPEYSRIAYAMNVDHRDHIFIMTADGAVSRQLTFGDSYDKFPTWSPDGQSLAYISYRNNTPNLFVMDMYGQNIRQLTFAEGGSTVLWPSWSPTSDVIAFSYNQAGTDIDFRLQVIKVDGTDRWELLSSADPDLSDHEPGWSPDGQTIYFLSNRTSQMEIWKVSYAKLVANWLSGNKKEYADIGLQQVSHLSSVNVNPDHRPRVSPDGQKIVFYGVGSDWHNIGTNLYTLNVDGSALTNITKSIDGDEWPDW